ncbi:hypothetical protein [Cellvibrio sp. NN19]|uniref:hypothetical protein n=1 Tax=Cellvibrio chitinivorans TaxID=3102792 RepID=UPI002B406376|nr:hypothetical protein [Cellvibrio sp. NN19]
MNENPYSPPVAGFNNKAAEKGSIETLLLSFLRHWNGRAKLISAFWGHFILGNFLFTLALILVSIGLQSVFSEPSTIAAIVQIALVILSFIYYICTVRFLWACAGNSNFSGFFYIVRGLILLALLFVGAIFAITGFEALTSS